MALLGQSLTSGIPDDGRHGSGTHCPLLMDPSAVHRWEASAGAGWPHRLARTRATVVEIRLEQRNRRPELSGVGGTPVRPGPASQPSRMKGRINSGFNSDSSRGRSTWKSWTWGGPGWALGAGPPGRWGIGSSEGWTGRGAVKK